MKKLIVLLGLLAIGLDLFGQPLTFTSVGTIPVAQAEICNDLFINYVDIKPPLNGWPAQFNLSVEVFSAPPNSNQTHNPWLYTNPWNQSTLFPCYLNTSPSSVNVPIINGSASTVGPGIFSIVSITHVPATNIYNILITNSGASNASIENLNLHFILDCALMTDALAGKKIIYRLGYNGSPIWYTLNSPTEFGNPMQILFSKLKPIVLPNQTFQVPTNYGTNKDWVFTYQNVGNTPANIRLTNFATTACNSYNFQNGNSLFYQISSSITPGPNWVNLTIPSNLPTSIGVNEYLHIKRLVEIVGCFNLCGSLYVDLNWQCRYPTPTSCTNCQEDISNQLTFNPGINQVKVSRLFPTLNDAKYNNACQGLTQNWQFKLENTGTTRVKDVNFSVSKNSQNSFSYIEDNSLSVSVCGSCIGSITKTEPDLTLNLNSCAGVGTSGINVNPSINVYIDKMAPGESYIVEFDVVNYFDDNIQFNQINFINDLEILSTFKDGCGSPFNSTSAVAPDLGQVHIGDGISGYTSFVSPPGTPARDLDLDVLMTGIPANITVYPPAGPPPLEYFGPTEFYRLDFDGLVGSSEDFQCMGFPNSNTSGYLKVEIHLDGGLSIGNANNVSLVFPSTNPNVPLQIIPFYSSGSFCPVQPPGSPILKTLQLIPINEYPVDLTSCSNCTAKDYIFYFRLSDFSSVLAGTLFSIEDLFNQGHLFLGLNACCTPPVFQANYKIYISLLPKEDCYSISTQGIVSATNLNANSCWIPLAKVDTKPPINIQCPGCRSPGIIVDHYEIFRTTYGYQDVDNDGLAENPLLPIDFYKRQGPLPAYSEFYKLNHRTASVGDELEDYLFARFEDGSFDYIPPQNVDCGYTYDCMKANLTYLDFIQIERTFPYSDLIDFDINMFEIDLYIDDPSLTCISPPLCQIDKDKFEFSEPLNYSAATGAKVTFSGSNLSNILQRQGDKFLITFSETELLALCNQPLSPCTLYNNAVANQIFDFKPLQRYRVATRYKICNNPQSTEYVGVLTSQVSNIMYLTGMQQNISLLPSQQPNTQSELNNNGTGYLITASVPPSQTCKNCCVGTGCTASNMTQAFANGHKFYCEGFSSNIDLLPVFVKNNTTYKLGNVPPINSSINCEATIQIDQKIRFNVSATSVNTFRYEVKSPNVGVDGISIDLPDDWKWTTVQGSNMVEAYLFTYSCETFSKNSCGFYHEGTSNFNSITSAPSLNFNYSNAPIPFTILNESHQGFSNVGSPFCYDEISAFRILLKLEPDVECQDLDTYVALTSESQIEFSSSPMSTQCNYPLASCSTYSITQNNQQQSPGLLSIESPNPNLVQTQFSPIPITVNTLAPSWTFEFYNQITGTTPSPAKNLYLAYTGIQGLPDIGVLSPFWTAVCTLKTQQLGGIVSFWNINSSDLEQGPYLWLFKNSPYTELPAGYYLEVVLTLNLDPNDCASVPNQFNMYWGWNCTKTTTPIATNVDICEANVNSLDVDKPVGTLIPFSIYSNPTMYHACSTAVVSVFAEFKNVSSTGVKPEFIEVIGAAPNATCSLVNCSSPQTTASYPGLQQQGMSPIWQILNPNNVVMEDEDCIAFELQVNFNDCYVGDQLLPQFKISGHDICGNYFEEVQGGAFISQGTSNCTDCFSILKTATPGPAIVGDPYTFDITVCGNNSGVFNATVLEIIPPNFIPIDPPLLPFPVFTLPSVPAQGCITVPVTGAFNNVGECTDLTNTAKILNTNNSSSACVDVVCPEFEPTIVLESSITGQDAFFSFPVVSGEHIISSQIIHVLDNVTIFIDINTTFNNCTFIFEAGSMIEVQPGINMNLNNDHMRGCPYMWIGILAVRDNKINSVSVTIEDAENAFHFLGGGNLFLKGTNLLNNIRGVYNDPNSNGGLSVSAIASTFGQDAGTLNSPYPGQTAYSNNSKVGVELYNSTLNMGSMSHPENSFFHLSNGIELYNCNATIANTYFENVTPSLSWPNSGRAVQSHGIDNPTSLSFMPRWNGLTTIENCTFGIYTSKVNANITATMRNVVNGIGNYDSEFRKVSIVGCYIEAGYIGIDWKNNFGAYTLNAIGNRIVVSGQFATGIYVEELTLSNPNCKINFNHEIEATKGAKGIYLNNIYGADVAYNNIFTSNQNTNPLVETIGIESNLNERTLIRCNQVYNLDPLPSSNSTITTGLSVSMGLNNSYVCNSFENTFFGARFSGACPGANLQTNIFADNWQGLKIHNGGEIGNQYHKGNLWINYQDLYGAIDLTSQNNEFQVNSNTPGIPMQLTPQVYPACDPSQLFFPDIGPIDETCPGNQSCIANIIDPNENSFEYLVARDSVNYFYYPNESKSIARLFLYNSILEDTTSSYTDSIFAAYVADNSSTPIDLLSQSSLGYKNLNSINSIAQLQLLYLDSLIIQKQDSLLLVDSLYYLTLDTNLLNTKETLIEKIELFNTTIFGIVQPYIQNAQDTIMHLSQINSQIVSSEIVYNKQKEMNEIYNQYKLGVVDVVSNNYQYIYDLAHQCPYQFGPAVYSARAFLALITDSNIYDDNLVCLQYGFFRTFESSNGQLDKNPAYLQIKPNPASQNVTVSLINSKDGIQNVILYDVKGKIVLEQNVKSNVKALFLNTQHLPDGFYFVRVSSENEIFNSKLVITK
jgi:Secretion system C-terminal sorting domain